MQKMPRRIIFGAVYALAFGDFAIASGQPSLSALSALLVDLPGWQGEKPDTMSMTQGTISVAYAARRYALGDRQITVMLGRSGLEQQAQMATGGREGDFSFDSGDTSMRSRILRGFRVFTIYDAENKDGMVLVYLGASSTFTLQFEHITLDDALALAQRFDWTAMHGAVAVR